MRIHQLSPLLANQIAAGEVVERPSSVVKELLENSLDAGATQIDIDIEKGGVQLIRIRDNGSGIDQEDLPLALSRHATSKVHQLVDLEKLLSLGFRGEALASISAVSRLTLTSKTLGQDAAFAVWAEGRDREIKITPAAHPVGTTVEVQDLFFNTPARRKFLRSEKTEFDHIEAVVRRIILARSDVGIKLQHNQKVLLQLRPAIDAASRDKRITKICGTAFSDSAINFDIAAASLRLGGWIATPNVLRLPADLHYFYVNGRIVRDKLINHAIRQVYQQQFSQDCTMAYVLYLDLAPQMVDVNVHPTKHEVRFREGRMVHDFIVDSLRNAFLSVQNNDIVVDETAVITEEDITLQRSDYSENVSYNNLRRSFPNTKILRETMTKYAVLAGGDPAAADSFIITNEAKQLSNAHEITPATSYATLQIGMCEGTQVGRVISDTFLTDALPISPIVPVNINQINTTTVSRQKATFSNFGTILTQLHDCYILAQNDQGLVIINRFNAQTKIIYGQLLSFMQQSNIPSQPLLIPITLTLNADLCSDLENQTEKLATLGIDAAIAGPNSALVRRLPSLVRGANITSLLPALLLCLKQNVADEELLATLAIHAISREPTKLTFVEMNNLLESLQQYDHLHQQLLPRKSWKQITLSELESI
ncbi:DNA mismatch repair endonuclease MutL [soil metagenome]